MNKGIKNFYPKSKGFMRMLLLCIVACLSFSQARADYYYKVKLAYKSGKVYKFNGGEWSGWIHVNQGSGLINALNKLVGGQVREHRTDSNGNLVFTLNGVEKSYSKADLEKLEKNDKGNYVVDGVELQAVFDNKVRVGTTVHDESDNEISFGYSNHNAEISDYITNDKGEFADNFYTKFADERTFNIVGLAIGRGSDGGSILQFSDYPAYTCIKGDLIELDLSAWNKNFASGSFYMSNMGKLEKLTLPNCEFAIGGEKMFAGCRNLKEIVFGDKTSITAIGNGAFKHGNNIPSATIQRMIDSAAKYAKDHPNANGIEYDKIGDEAFYECYKIITIDIPEGIKAIGSEAFRMTKNPSNFTTLILSTNNNLEIGHSAFRGCEILKDVTINDGTKITKLGEAAFSDSRSLTNTSVKNILENYCTNSVERVEVNGQQVKYIPAHLFFGVQGRGDKNPQATLNFTELTIPADFGAIGEGAFGHTESDIQVLNKITVKAAVAPKCGIPEGVIDNLKGYKNVFQSVAPNKVTITFDGAADGYDADGNAGYKTYRAENEFMRLLTKTLNENNETYDVYPQMYADVKLTRSFKQGWNTLALPFGSPRTDRKDTDCAEVYTKALGCSDIAAYRGLRENSQDASKSVFTFLHYANVQDNELDEFEPILVKMSATETKEYTFTNVDLNYEHDNGGKLYTAAKIVERGCVKSTGGLFDGQYNHDDPTNFPLFNGNNYNTFYFDGTFSMIKDENNSIFKEGDYIIQDGKFIMCKTGKKYGMKGFRGYFKKFESATLGASDAINIAVYDGDGTVTDIVRVDANGEAEANAPHDIYNVMGQKVRSNALSTEGLKSGIYIINGKKVLVK